MTKPLLTADTVVECLRGEEFVWEFQLDVCRALLELGGQATVKDVAEHLKIFPLPDILVSAQKLLEQGDIKVVY